ncbi:flagellar hook protein FlgE [Agrobacterium sp. rho-13.3]|jgi:flagellar hook protein FlgE|uniref:flagellar hook protein FlgE n=1 Tax=Agrobacterium sp. rho-13.3 TaxID=3072980 RepID=UPI002A0FDD3E|nr:flagellar hook protein FlgE [Agrobacterium sp. rho-13.3]MDX8310488.1 flagellar hook protein FlgE [Agrobacterium sp. rho-13.3]
MSLFGTMKTAVSGMNGQANRLGTVGDNIANASTTGYKSASTSFSSLVLSSNGGNYNSGGVITNVNYSISQQGALQSTQSSTDLAIQGDGFFVVQDTAGNIFLTRAGSFTTDQNGFLVNDAGFTLLGYQYSGTTPTTVINSYDGLVPVNVSSNDLSATASTSGILKGNLSASVTAVDPADLPSENTTSTNVNQENTLKTSVTAYDALGNSIKYDFFFSKTDDGEWEVSVYDAANATPPSDFPYTDGPVTTSTLNFDGTGKLESIDGDADLTSIDVNGVSIDLSSMTQLAATKSTISEGGVNGNAAEAVQSIQVSADGTVYATYAKSAARPLFQIPLADVASPDNLTVLSGNVFQTSNDSGVVTLGFAGSNGFGSIASSQLESSNVDIATELTEMIQAQRSYTANSKVFQTGSDLMDVLINLVR